MTATTRPIPMGDLDATSFTFDDDYVPVDGSPALRRRVIHQRGHVIGHVYYVRHRRPDGGSDYGWRPEHTLGRRPTYTLADAVRRLPRYAAQAGAR